MSPLVRLQMRTFRIHLVTTGNIATVHFPPTQHRLLTTFPILNIIIIIVIVIVVVIVVTVRRIASRYNPAHTNKQKL